MSDKLNSEKDINEVIIGFRRELDATNNNSLKDQLSAIKYIFTIAGTFLTLIFTAIAIFSFIYLKDLSTTAREMSTSLNTFSRDVNNDINNRINQIDNKIDSKLNNMDQNFNHFTDRKTDELNSSIEKIQNNFDKLSGQALLKPDLQLYYNGKELDGQTIDIDIRNLQVEKPLIFSLKNNGNKSAESPSVHLYFSINVSTSYNSLLDDAYPQASWQPQSINTSLFKSKFNLFLFKETSKINPKDNWTLIFPFDPFDKIPESFSARLEVHYGGEPLIVNFYIRPIKR